MTNTIYLNGCGAYRTNGIITTARVKKADFTALLTGLDEFDVIVTESVAEKYARQISRKGYILTANTRYNMFDVCLHYKSYDIITPFHAPAGRV